MLITIIMVVTAIVTVTKIPNGINYPKANYGPTSNYIGDGYLVYLLHKSVILADSKQKM